MQVMKERLSDLYILALMCLAALVLHSTGIGCPIRFFTGVSCAGCGMMRALFAAAHGNFEAAFRFHPLFPLVPLAGIFWLFRRRFSLRTQSVLTAAFALLFLVVWLGRLLLPGDVVSFRPADGAVFRLLRRLKDVLFQLR